MSRQICVYCASTSNLPAPHIQAAQQLGRLIGEHGDTLVYGGGSIGLMGEVARAVHQHGGRVVGVIPEFMTKPEVAYHNADELVVTDDMRQRKAEMERRADAFVVLPGGFGTLEEVAEIVTLRYLRQHEKPVIIVNVNGFYDPLVELFEHFVREGFAKPRAREAWRVVPDPTGAYEALAA